MMIKKDGNKRIRQCISIYNKTKKKNEKLVRVNSSCVRVKEQIKPTIFRTTKFQTSTTPTGREQSVENQDVRLDNILSNDRNAFFCRRQNHPRLKLC